MDKASYGCLIWALLQMTPLFGQLPTYQAPSNFITQVADQTLPPSVLLSPDKDIFVVMHHHPYVAIQEVGTDDHFISDFCMNTPSHRRTSMKYYRDLTLQPVADQQPIKVSGLPISPRIQDVGWAPNGKNVAFTHTTADDVELWVIDVSTASAKKLCAGIDAAIPGNPYHWFSDGHRLLVQRTETKSDPLSRSLKAIAPTTHHQVDEESLTPKTPDPFSISGREAHGYRFIQSHLFTYDLDDQSLLDFGISGAIVDVLISPDDRYVLIKELNPPISELLPRHRHAIQSSLYSSEGTFLRKVADQPSACPQWSNPDAVPEGPRNIDWRSDKPATLYWVEAQDGGDPDTKSPIRDRLFLWPAPFSALPLASVTCTRRFHSIFWGDDNLAVLREQWRSDQEEIVSLWQPGAIEPIKKVLFDKNLKDLYADPGHFLTEYNEWGRVILMRTNDDQLFLSGKGASPTGSRPFIDIYDPGKGTKKRLWQSKAPYYEVPLTLIDQDNGILLLKKESPDTPPNYFIRDLDAESIRSVTHFTHPNPALQGVQKELIKFQRPDGIELTGSLYLPKEFSADGDTLLPVLMWVRSEMYTSRERAIQVKKSPYEFLQIHADSPALWALRGFAVFDDLEMPILTDEKTSESQVDQWVASATAAIDKLVLMGIADVQRIAVGGYADGACVAANLLAHSNLFAAGIGLNGTYNHTLTPFGFHAELRTFWEVPDIYFDASPFMHADKIKAPLLLIHGEQKDFSLQSEHFYHALKAHGAETRLVPLPYEGSIYRGRESTMHLLWEIDRWLHGYVRLRK